MRRITALILAFLAGTGSAMAAPDTIEIPFGDLKLKAFLYRPEGNGPFPAVVALHGCDGLAGTHNPLGRRYREWGEKLLAAGFVVVFPDSFGSRKLGAQCNVTERKLRSGRERVGDAEAARKWLQVQDYVAPERVSLLGWANGAVTALWTVRPHAGAKDGKPDFRSAVALYPGCRRLRDTAWSARAPTLILVGAKDDWTPANICEQMVSGARGRSAQVAITVYPGAYHNFDHPNLALQMRTGIVSASGTTRAHVGTDPVARADAFRRVPEWLAR